MDIAFFFMTILRLFLELLSRIVFYIKYRNYEHKSLPPITNKLLLESAVSLAAKIRSREVSSFEVVNTFIDRINDTNPSLNAVVETRFDVALEEAKTADHYLRENPDCAEELSKNKPFFGVPFTAKDAFQVKGLRHTAGVYARKDLIGEEDAVVIELMKDAGGIFLATTNVPEMVMWWETSNTIYGTTNNPYAFNRTPGGSSGGEGSIISAAGSPMGIGSDIGGSIRMPAYYNGIFGHKPSSRVTDDGGHFPPVSGELKKYQTCGPLSRHVADLRQVMKILVTPDHVHHINFDKKVDFKNIKIFYMEDDGCPLTTPVDKELRASVRKTVEHFKNIYKVPCLKVELPKLKDIVYMFNYRINNDELTAPGSQLTFNNLLANGEGGINVLWEVAKKCVGIKGVHTCPALFWAATSKLWNRELRPSHYKSTMKAANELEEEFKGMLGDNVVLIYPPHPTLPVYHNESLFKPFNYNYTAVFNIFGLPATQCTIGLNSSGLPLGVQVVGGLYQDGLCLAVAEEIERAFGGWVSPSVVKI